MVVPVDPWHTLTNGINQYLVAETEYHAQIILRDKGRVANDGIKKWESYVRAHKYPGGRGQ